MNSKEFCVLLISICVWTKASAGTTTADPPVSIPSVVNGTTDTNITSGTTTVTVVTGSPSQSGETSAEYECDKDEVRDCFMKYAEYATIAVSLNGKHRAHICRMDAEGRECEEKTRRCSEYLWSYLSIFRSLLHHVCGEDQGSFGSDEVLSSTEDSSYDISDIDWKKKSESRSHESGSRARSESHDHDLSGDQSGSYDRSEYQSGSYDRSGSQSGSKSGSQSTSGSQSESREESGSSGKGSTSYEKDDEENCSPTCDLQASAVCFLQFMDVLSDMSITGICRQSLWSAKCMTSAVVGCSAVQKHAIMILVNKMMLTHQDFCGSGSCELEKAMPCLEEAGTTIHVLLNQLTLAPLLCGKLQGSLACVYNHTFNCEMSDFSSMERDSMEQDENTGKGDNSSVTENPTSAENTTMPGSPMGDNTTISKGNNSMEDDDKSDENTGNGIESLMFHLHILSLTAHGICKELMISENIMKGAWLGGDLAYSILLGLPYTRPKDICGQVSMDKESPVIMTGGNFEKCRRRMGLFDHMSSGSSSGYGSGESGHGSGSMEKGSASGSKESGSASGSKESGSASGSKESGSASGSKESGSASGSKESGSASGSKESGSASGSKESGSASGSKESGSASGSKESGSASGSKESGSASGSKESGSASGSKESGSASGSKESGSASGSKESGNNQSKGSKDSWPESEEDYRENYRFRESYFNDVSEEFLWGLYMDHKGSQQMFHHIVSDTCIKSREQEDDDCQTGLAEVTEAVNPTTTTSAPASALCEFEDGMTCIQDSNVHEMALQVFLSSGKYKEAIQEMCLEVGRTLTCAYDNIVGCSDYQKNLVKNAIHKLMYIVGNQCHDQLPSTTAPSPPTRAPPTTSQKCPEIKPKCRVGDIEEECFSSEMSPTCDSVNSTMHCVGDLIRPCHQMQTAVAMFMLDNIKRELPTDCPGKDLESFFDLPNEDSTRLSKCSLQTASEFRLAIDGVDEPTQRLCMAFWSFSKCKEDLHLPSASRYLLSRSEALFNDFFAEHCMTMDYDTKDSDVCEQPMDKGPCEALMPRYFYNSASKVCEPFSYGGCEGNDNNFESAPACMEMCAGPDSYVCDQPMDIGPCKALVPRFFYNSTSKMCEPFSYGGCEGNDNNFESTSACMEMCARPDTVTEEQCDSSKASVCLSTNFLKLFTKSFMPFSHQSSVCSNYDEVRECVKDSMMTCSSSVQSRHANALELYHSVYQLACPLIRPEIPDMHSCLPYIAEASLQFFSVMSLANTGIHNIDETCRELSYTLSVVHAATLNCSDDQVADISNSLDALRSFIGNKCPAITRILHCNSNSSYLVDDPKTGEVNQSCSTLPSICDANGWMRCLPSTVNETTICGTNAMSSCMTSYISGCQDSDVSDLYENFTAYITQVFQSNTVAPCDIAISWPAPYDQEMGAGNCTGQFIAGLEEQFLFSPNPDQTVLCSMFSELMECIDGVSSSLPVISQRLVQTLGSKMVAQLTELCQGAAESPCEVGDPLKDDSGEEYFCGRGSSGFCPSDSRCVISPTDTFAVCCAKVKNSTEKDCGSAPADLVFLVDESSSIGASNFQVQKDFVKSLINNPVIADNIETGLMQVALVTFSRDPIKRFGLNTYTTAQDMFDNIDSIPYNQRGTEIEKGLKFVRQNTLTEAEGARAEAPKIVILLTDGSSSDNSENEANLLRDMDVTLLVIGIGNVDMVQLKAIAGDDKFLFTVDDFSELSGIAEQFVASIPCPEEPLTCHLTEAVQCYQNQARSLLTGLLPIAARGSVCSVTEVYSDCVTNMTVTCSSEKQQKFVQLSQWTKQLVRSQGICQSPEDYTPKYCHPEEAAPCLAAMSRTIARYQHTPVRSAICSQIQTTETCVLKSIQDCDENRRRSVLQAYWDMTILAHLACVAPQVPKPMPPVCGEEGNMCNDIGALNCLVTAHTKLVASGENRESVCNAVVAAKYCVKRQIAGCDVSEKSIIHGMYEKLTGRMGNMCPEIYCERCGALQCIEDLSNMLKAGEKDMCNMIERTKKCVEEKARHCSDEDQKKIYVKLDYVVTMTASHCDRIAMHCITAFNSVSVEILKHNKPDQSMESSGSGSQSNSNSGGSKSKGSSESGSQTQSSRKKRSTETSGSKSTKSGSGSGGKSGEESGSKSAEGSSSHQGSTEEEEEIICEDQLDSDYKMDIDWPVDIDRCYIEDYGSEESGSNSKQSGSKSEVICGELSTSGSGSKESKSGSGQSTASGSGSKESQSGSGQSKASGSGSQESQSGSGQSTASGSGSKESQSGSHQSTASGSGSQESQSGSHQSTASGSGSQESQSESAGSSETSAGSGEAKTCMNRLAWMCRKARLSWNCVQEAMLMLPEDRQQVMQQALTGVWTSVQYRCAASKLQCFSCKKEDSNEACNARAVQTCSANQQACETVVDFGAKVVTKGCVNPNSCKTQCTGNGKKCSYCCRDNLCNQPWDNVITESRTCVGLSAVSCAFSLVKSVAHMKELSCSEVEASMQCMKRDTKSCISSQYLSIREHVTQLESSTLLTKCRLRQLHCHCGLCGGMALGITIQNYFRTDETICRHLQDTIHGSSLATVEQICSPTDFQASFQSLRLAWSVIGDTCKMVPRIPDSAPSSGEITPNNTSQESGETICDMEAAIECIDSDMARQEVLRAMMYGFDHICSAGDLMMQCVENHVKGCSGDIYTKVWERVMYETAWVRGHCERIATNTNDMCDIETAMQCVTNLGSISSVAMMCQNKNLTMECVSKNTASCLSIQKAPIDFLMGELKFAMEDMCNTDMEDDSFGDIYHDLAECVVGFGHRIDHSMKVIGSNATNMVCEAVSQLQSCLYNEKLPPLAKLYTQSMAKMTTSFTKHVCSTDDLERPLYCHVCDKQEGTDCQSSTRLAICDPITERCGSMSRTLEDGSVVYSKGCVPKDKCDLVCPSPTNCSYCCQTDFCNAGHVPDVTITTKPPMVVTEEAACGYSVADIVILLDESSSIGQTNFVTMSQFVNNIITQLNIGEESIHLGLATFSGQGYFGFSLDTYYEQKGMTDFVTQLAGQYGTKSGTNVASGLQLVQSQLFSGNANRPDIPDVLVVITDGAFESGYESAVTAIQQTNISVLVVGIGNNVVQSQLLDVASASKYVFTVDNFDVLDAIVGDFVQTIPCPPEPPSCMLHEAASCMSGPLVRVLVTPFTPLLYRHSLCSELDMVEECLSTSLVNCPSSNTNTMYKMAAWMKVTSNPMCLDWTPPPIVCNDTSVEMCLRPVIEKLPYKLNPTGICPALDATLKCLMAIMDGNCSRDNILAVSQSLHIVRGIVGDSCPALSEDLCALANPDTLRQDCDATEVTTCVESFKNFVDGYSFFNTEEEACKEYNLVQECLEDHSAHCDPSVRQTAEAQVVTSFATLNIQCTRAPRVCPLPGQCSITTAFEDGVKELRETPTCASGNALLYNFSKEIYDCNSIQRFSAKTEFMSLLSECPPISLLVTAADDIFVPLTVCLQSFNTAVNKALMNYNSGIKDLCPAVRGVSRCFKDFYETLEHVPAKLLSSGLLNNTHQIFDEFIDTSCFDEVIICERDSFTLTCPPGEVVHIQEAFYGRVDDVTCVKQTTSILNKSCSSSVALERYKAICDNQNSCSVTASNSVTGDPCVGTPKYARITYTCAPANPVNVTEVDECRQKDVERCLNSYLSNVMFLGLLRIEDREELCRSSLSLDTCISDGMARCSSQLQSQYDHVYSLGQSVVSSGGVCKEMDKENEEEEEDFNASCSPYKAWQCIAELGMDLSYYKTNQEKDDICRIAEHSSACYHYHLNDCADPINNSISTTMKKVTHYALQMCQEDYRKPDDVFHFLPPTCVDTEMKTDYPCDHVKALGSLAHLFDEIFNPYGSQQRLCIEYAHSLQSIYSHINACPTYIRRNVLAGLKTIQSFKATGSCSLEVKSPCQPPSSNCKIHYAESCVERLKVKLSEESSEVDDTVCSMRAEVKKCIDENIGECSKTEVYQVTQQYYAALQIIGTFCDGDDGDDESKEVVDPEVTDIYGCISGFHIKVSKVLELAGTGRPTSGSAEGSVQASESNTGSGQTSGSKAESGQVSGSKAESGQTSGSKAESGQTSGSKAESGLTSGSKAESGQTSGSKAESGLTSGSKAESGQTSGSKAESGQMSGSKAESGQTSGSKAGSGQTSGSGSGKMSGSGSGQTSGSGSGQTLGSTGGASQVSDGKDCHEEETELAGVCADVKAAWHCIQTNLPRLAFHERVILNHTLYAVYQAAEYTCRSQVCHSCTELEDNDLCNKQHPQECGKGEVCYAQTKDSKLYKGCQSAGKCDQSCASNEDCGYCCTGYLCNKPPNVEDPLVCDVTRAVSCAMEVVSIVSKSDMITERVLSASLTCMATFSQDCSSDNLTIIYKVSMIIREMLTVSGCGAESSLYKHCGTVGVLTLGRIAKSPFASDRTKCSLLNATQTLLDTIEQSQQCFSNELAPVLQSMEEVKTSFIGDACSEDFVQPRCHVDAVFSCFGVSTSNITTGGVSMTILPICVNSSLWETNKCLVDNLAACTSVQKATISGFINMFVNLIESTCSASDVSEWVEFTRNTVNFDSDLEVCISGFSNAVMGGLNGDRTDVCDAFVDTISCVGDLELSPFQKALGRSFVTLTSESYDAAYNCIGQTGENLVFCEHETISIECPAGEMINIKEAFYGRENDVTCTGPGRPVKTIACRSDVALEKYKEICHDKNSCSLQASNSVTGDPCGGTFKYARVSYTCENTGINGSVEVTTCDLGLTYGYLAHLTIQLYTSRLFTQSSVYDICRDAAMIKSFVQTSMRSCPSDPSLNTLLELFDIGVSQVCVGDIPAVDNDQLTLGECNVAMAEECFKPIIPYFGANVRDADGLCWELESLQQCIHRYQPTCQDAEFKPVTDSWAVVMATFGGKCEFFDGLPGICSVDNGLSCIDDLIESSTGCSNINEVKACIDTNVVGCSSLSALIVRFHLIGSVQHRLPSCDQNLQTNDPVVDDLISFCAVPMDNLTSIYLSGDSPSSQTCDTLSFFINCLKTKSEEMNIIVLKQALQEYQPMYTAMINRCKKISEEFVHAGSCPVIASDTVGTCAKECFYDGECTQTEKCCSNGCGTSCVPAVGDNVIAFDTQIQTSGSSTTDYTYTLLSDYGYALQATSIVFEVKACNDAHVGLKEDDDPDGNLYEIVMGGWSNSKSVIRTVKQGDNKVEHSGAVLDCNEYKRFNVSWSGGVVTVMRDTDSGWVQLMTWSDLGGGLDVQFVGLTTARWSSGSWKVGQLDAESQGNCDVGLAKSCLASFTVYSVLGPFLGDSDRQFQCSLVNTKLGSCSYLATTGCPESIAQHDELIRYLGWTGLHTSGLCEEQVYSCSPSMAVQCMNELSFLIGQKSSMLEDTSAMDDVPDVCSVYEKSRTCMTRHLYGCSTTHQKSVQKTFEELECLMGNQCQITEEPSVTEKVTECIDIESVGGSGCSLPDAMKCLQDLRWTIASPFSKEGSICLSYSKAAECFVSKIPTCFGRLKKLTVTVFEEFAPFVSDCPTVFRSPCQEVEDLCQYSELTACVDVVRELMLTSAEDAQLCVAFSNAWDCINAKSTDCSSSHIISIERSLSSLENEIRPFLTCDNTLQVCYYRYIEIVQEILTKQPNSVAPTSGSGSGSKSASGSGSKSASGSGSQPASGSGSKSASGSGSQPASGSVSQPASGSVSQPASGSGSKSASGSGSQPASGSGSKSASGSGSQPASGSGSQPAAGSGSQPASVEVWDNSASCDAVIEAYDCIQGKLLDSVLPKALISMFDSIIADLYNIIEEKCQGMSCYYCKKKKSNDECNKAWSVCAGSQQACETVVEKDKITKGCVAPDKCTPGTKGKKTTYCCYGHLCNEPGDTAYYDPPTCDILVTSQTIITLLTKVIEASNGYSTIFCSNVMLTVQELTSISGTCSILTGDRIGVMKSRLMTAEESLCTIQVLCERQQALDAIATFDATIRSSANSDLICSEYQKTMQFLFTKWSTCSPTEIAEMQMILDNVTSSVDLTCQLMPNIEYTPPSEVIRIVEGGDPKMIEFVLQEDPSTKCNKNSCHVVISMVLVHTGDDKSRTCSDDSLIPQLVVGDYNTAGSCGYNFTSDNWNTKVSVPFLAVSDGLYDGEHTVDVEVTATKYEDGISVLVRKIATYQFLVIDADKRSTVCTSVNDPHITTFDKMYYDNFLKGEFVLYRHTVLPYEVRAVFTKCGKASCNCAMMVKSGDDFFSVDKCSSRKFKISMHLTNTLTVGTQMYIIPNGEKYQQIKVTFPTGTEVIAQMMRKLINIRIIPSPSDFGRTQGLCGTYDGDVTNDLLMSDGTLAQVDSKYLRVNRPKKLKKLYPNDFSRSWQIRQSFNNYWFYQQFTASILSFQEENSVYCTCPASAASTTEPCHSIRPAMTCPFLVPGIDLIAKAKSLISGTDQSALNQVQARRRRRQAAEVGFADEDEETQATSWPAGIWTEAAAEAFCENLLTNSTLAQSCASVDTADAVEGCKDDIMQTEDTEFAEASVTNQIGKCVDELQKDPATNTDPAAQAVANGILDQTCEANCNDNGDCQKGVCRCYNGFVGTSCSVAEGEAPVITGLDQNVCDIGSGAACNSVAVEGEKFVDLPTLTCHFQTVEMISGVFLKSTTETTAPANFISFDLVECELPASITPVVPVRAVLVSVSNNGAAKSTGDHYYIAYNSLCYTCDPTSCQTTLDGCVIESQCYGVGDVSAANPCHFCDPVTSVTAWTVKLAHYCPNATTTIPTTTTTTPTTPSPSTEALPRDDPSAVHAESVTPIIITGVIAGVSLLALVVTAGAFLIYRQRNSVLKEMRLKESDSESSSGSGPRGWSKHRHTQDLFYDNSAYNFHYGIKEPQVNFAKNIPKRHSQMSRRDPTYSYS
ncbi:uncharacterized protein [Argopecten irradians]|uniref:uncharacterized protein isoform X2 n=1 Tax=Argopecten irradians TaxID=31199 RepID=UPI003712E4E9